MEITLVSIGVVKSSRTETLDDNWDAETSSIELADNFPEDCLAGLLDFSHVEVVFYMDQVDKSKIVLGSRHPRNRADWPKVGIFAQRGKNRPNQLGVTVCRILSVEGRTLKLEGLDAVAGTPVLDIKPWIQEFGPRDAVKQPAWASELMRRYWK